MVAEERIIYEEDTEKAFETCVAILGPVGRMIYPSSPILCDARIYTKEHGYLWYGDIAKEDINFTTHQLTQALGCAVEIVDQYHILEN